MRKGDLEEKDIERDRETHREDGGMNEGDDYLGVDEINSLFAWKMMLYWFLCIAAYMNKVITHSLMIYIAQEKLHVALLKSHFSFA